jgi:hypothetical protein
MRKTALTTLIVLTAWTASAAIASEPAKPKDPPPARAVKRPPPGLTGNTVPQCEAGNYAAGGICRPSPPDHYVPSGGKYPIPCPKGAKSPAGSKAESYCVGGEAKPPDKKGAK